MENWRKWKKGNKQCLFDTPRRVMVNKNNDVKIQSACNVVAKYQIVPS